MLPKCAGVLAESWAKYGEYWMLDVVPSPPFIDFQDREELPVMEDWSKWVVRYQLLHYHPISDGFEITRLWKIIKK